MKMNSHQVLNQMLVMMTLKRYSCMHTAIMIQVCWEMCCMGITCWPNNAGDGFREDHLEDVVGAISTSTIRRTITVRHMPLFFPQMPLQHTVVLVGSPKVNAGQLSI